jgi:phasin family protein
MDMNKMMEMFDMKKMADMWNVENVKGLSEKSLAKCKEANEVLVEGMSSYTKKQAELTKSVVEANIEAAKEVAAAKTVEEFVSKQHTAVEAWVERNTKAVQELSEIAKSSQEKAAEILKNMAK